MKNYFALHSDLNQLIPNRTESWQQDLFTKMESMIDYNYFLPFSGANDDVYG